MFHSFWDRFKHNFNTILNQFFNKRITNSPQTHPRTHPKRTPFASHVKAPSEPSEARRVRHYSLCMLPDAQKCRNASSRSVRHPDVQKCFQTVINASRRSAVPLDGQECIQILRNASRRSGMHLDAEKDFQVLRIDQTPQNCLNLFTQILSRVAKGLKLKRASRSNAKTGFKRYSSC